MSVMLEHPRLTTADGRTVGFARMDGISRVLVLRGEDVTMYVLPTSGLEPGEALAQARRLSTTEDRYGIDGEVDDAIDLLVSVSCTIAALPVVPEVSS